MNAPSKGNDIARQALTVVAAVLQFVLPAIPTMNVGRVSDQTRTTIIPAGYAFAIWGLIYTLLAAYAVWQALPRNREHPLFRRIGWPLVANMLLGSVWIVLYTTGAFIPAQFVIVGIFFAIGLAYWRYATFDGPTSGFDRWVVAPALGFNFGWLTAAVIVSLPQTLVRLGWEGAGRAAEVGGGALLLAAAGIAVVNLLRSAPAMPTLWLPYGLTIIWALVAVVVNQRETAPLTANVATGLIPVIAVTLIAAFLVRGGQRGSATAAA